MTENPVEPNSRRILSRWDWAAFWVATLAAFVVYFYTLAPTLTLEDSGELAVAGDYLGVPHPPGYPIWTILAWVFARVFSFVDYLGHPNPAWGINLLSAVFGALAAGVAAMLVCASGRDMLSTAREALKPVGSKAQDLICFAAGVSSSLLFAFSPVMWSQAVIVEVYTLNAFFVSLILLLAYLWMRHPSDRLLYATAIAFGIGMANWWPSVLLTIGPIVLVIMFRNMNLFRDFAVVGLVLCGMIVLNVWLAKQNTMTDPKGNSLHPWAGKLLWSSGPYTKAFWVYAAVNLLAIILGWIFLPHGKTVALTFLLIEAGLLVYLYMPLSSDLRNPPMNWAYPRTWGGFMHAITRGQYEKLAPSNIFTMRFLDQLGLYTTELRVQFTLPLALLGFLPFAGMSVRTGQRRINGMIVAVPLAALALVLVAIEDMIPGGSTGVVRAGYMASILGIFFLLAAGAAGLLLSETRELAGQFRLPGTDLLQRILIVLVFVMLIGLFAAYEAGLGAKLFTDIPPAAKLGVFAFMAGPVLLAALVAWLMFGDINMEFDIDLRAQQWILVTVVCFVFMSILMVIGANPKVEIQDMFIQRVKFIASHALYAFWIGYGMIIGGAFVHRFFKGNSIVLAAGTVIMLLLPVYPVIQNAPFSENRLNSELLRIYGGAGQRDHDFGWQFGNYQLKGLEAIKAELEPGEEPPPDTGYPPEMEQGAIFFGGTDPGRFVPTYMIYSARVREDVFLITQNALADHTYMSVMRDLYGDRIWIPAVCDNNAAFREYAEQNKNNVNFKLGRVVVQGVQQVMAINGILCKKIHDHNKWRHPFYVEESYVIPWMYPYMTPHGLCLKLNAEPTPIDPELVKKDMDFWAWYTKRLTTNDRFRYDAVARKSFSKLRSAIAGLYENRGLQKQSEQAYLEAVDLCPISPEAHFRLAQMYARTGRFDEGKEIMLRFKRQDPDNVRVDAFLNEIEHRQSLFTEMLRLQKVVSEPGCKLQDLINLSRVYQQVGNVQGFIKVNESILGISNAPPDAALLVAQMYAGARMYDRMGNAIEKFEQRAPGQLSPAIYKQVGELYAQGNKLREASQYMEKYLKLMPVDYAAWHELGVMYVFQKKGPQALHALEQSVGIGGEKARKSLREDSRLGSLRGHPRFQRLIGGPA